MAAKIAACVLGGSLFCGTAYVVAVTVAPPLKYTVSNDHRINKFDELAPCYDSKTKSQEFYLGIGRMRRQLLKEATGRVLEVGCGSASNLGLYHADECDQVIFCDRSPAMIDMCRKKIVARLHYHPYEYPHFPVTKGMIDIVRQSATAAQGAGAAASSSSADITVLAKTDDELRQLMQEHKGVLPIDAEAKLSPSDALELQKRQVEIVKRHMTTAPLREERKQKHVQKSVEESPGVVQSELYAVALYPAEHMPFADNSFDTVVDMFGICSFDDPVAALREMSRVCKPSGKILLLEHGKGSWDRLNDYLDKFAPRHAKMWGCWWNRDIRRYVRLAGLAPSTKNESHFGTTQMLVCTPYKHTISR